MAMSHEFGQRAEQVVAAYLQGRGWRILARNWRFRHKELDLVAKRGQTVAFIEVKARRAPLLGHPLDAITVRKRREMALAARAWVAIHGQSGDTYRFDAAVMIAGPGGLAVEHFEDAWRLERWS
jgi:putative endonuclease